MDRTTIRSLAEEVSKRLSKVPPHMTYWGKGEIADCLGISNTLVSQIIKLPDFPPSYNFPNGIGGTMHPKWLAKEVMDWASCYRGKEARL